MERSCLSTAKHVDTVVLTWKLIDMSEWRRIPRSQTAADGFTKSVLTLSGACGSWLKSTTCRGSQSSPHLVGGDLNEFTQRHDQCTFRCVIAAPGMLMDDRNRRSVSNQHSDTGSAN